MAHGGHCRFSYGKWLGLEAEKVPGRPRTRLCRRVRADLRRGVCLGAVWEPFRPRPAISSTGLGHTPCDRPCRRRWPMPEPIWSPGGGGRWCPPTTAAAWLGSAGLVCVSCTWVHLGMPSAMASAMVSAMPISERIHGCKDRFDARGRVLRHGVLAVCLNPCRRVRACS